MRDMTTGECVYVCVAMNSVTMSGITVSSVTMSSVSMSSIYLETSFNNLINNGGVFLGLNLLYTAAEIAAAAHLVSIAEVVRVNACRGGGE